MELSQEPEIQPLASLSPRRTSLRISSRKSFNRSVLESNQSISSSHRVTQNELLVPSDGKFENSSISDTSSLDSEDFDRLIKNQLFNIPDISFSPLQYKSVETRTNIGGKSEQVGSKLSNVDEVTETIKKEDERPYRSSLNLKSRKSLSRMVLERNACLAYTSTPQHSFIDETETKEIDQSEEASSMEGVSEMSLSSQRLLDRMMAQSFGIPHCSILLRESSVDNRNNSTSDDKSRVKDNEIEAIPNVAEVERDSLKSIREDMCVAEQNTGKSLFKIIDRVRPNYI